MQDIFTPQRTGKGRFSLSPEKFSGIVVSVCTNPVVVIVADNVMCLIWWTFTNKFWIDSISFGCFHFTLYRCWRRTSERTRWTAGDAVKCCSGVIWTSLKCCPTGLLIKLDTTSDKCSTYGYNHRWEREKVLGKTFWTKLIEQSVDLYTWLSKYKKNFDILLSLSWFVHDKTWVKSMYVN